MSETADMLHDVTVRLFEKYAGQAGADGLDPAAVSGLWSEINELGLPLALVPEAHGGSGLCFSNVAPVLQEIGRYALPVPLPETMIAALLLARAGLRVPPGMLSVAPVRDGETLTLTRTGGTWSVFGQVTRIPWARAVVAIAALADWEGQPHVVILDPMQGVLTPGSNAAGEPRDTLRVDCVLDADHVAPLPKGCDLTSLGIAARTAQIAGALNDMVALSATYAGDRVQFGRPIAKFQAVQHLIAVLAGHAAVAASAADLAAEAIDEGGARLDVAIAKASASEAAGEGAAIAHQVHGAIGVTREYRLHRSTLRLLSWREEFGAEAFWQAEIGRAAFATGGGGALWASLAR